MKTVAFVPVKLNNERFPGKNLKQFSDGTPLISVILQKLTKIKDEGFLDAVYCYCSNNDICSYLPEGVEFLKRPEFLDDSLCLGSTVYAEFVKTIESDIYVLCHATAPFTSEEHIIECIQKVKNDGYESAFAGQKHQAFFWKDGKPLNFELSKPPRTQDMDMVFTENPSPYVFTRKEFLKYHSRSGMNAYICECSAMECVDIDNADDFELAEAVYSYLQRNKGQAGEYDKTGLCEM